MSKKIIATIPCVIVPTLAGLAPGFSSTAVGILSSAPLNYSSIAFSSLLGLGIIVLATSVFTSPPSKGPEHETEEEKQKRHNASGRAAIGMIVGIAAMVIGGLGTLSCMIAGQVLLEQNQSLFQETLSGRLLAQCGTTPSALDRWALHGVNFGLMVAGVVVGAALAALVYNLVPQERQIDRA